jgi:Flp pilus assembly protein TadG
MLHLLNNRLSEFRRSTSGAALIEFTIMMPILFSLAFGVTEFGRLIQHHHTVQKSMRDAARYLGRIDVDCATPGADWAAAVVNAKNLAMRGSTLGTDPLILPYWSDAATITVTLTCFNNASGAYFDQDRGGVIPLVSVSAAVPYQDIGMLSFFGIASVTLNLSHDEMNIGA